eukprot:TRINITY_DN113043_c0_g1_i2.p1 TRINITY_DN113043_c0_g1~~TRINITY_DN113043_c0_g1_i2.p1  ORF type:complete len:421 (-),score=61.26 TRINITY_DN113043_c0_g1_i2:143-1405(-)
MKQLERELATSIEVLSGRLWWVSLSPSCFPTDTARSHFFSVDHELVYEPFHSDFGPLNMALVYRYCRRLAEKLHEPALASKKIVHYCSNDPKKRANAAFLVGAYQVIVMQRSAAEAYDVFRGVYPPFLAFRDACSGPCSYQCTILDCLEGLEYAMKLKWFDYRTFDVESYEYFEKVEHGDMNWVVPDRFLAFAGPFDRAIDPDGYPATQPEDLVPIFQEAGIGLIVRLNHADYDRQRFIRHGIKHVDLYFLDGSCPPPEVVVKFLHVVENEPTAIAVHCKAGLGRTGTLIGLWAMKHHHFPARAYIGWNRICRPGSVLGPQQKFLCEMEQDMFQAGMAARARPTGGLAIDWKSALNEAEHLRGLSAAEQQEDVGQGNRLCNAKRSYGNYGRPAPGVAGKAFGAAAPLTVKPLPPGAGERC